MNQILVGQKVKLRALELEDVNLLYNWENDPEFWDISITKSPLSKHLLEQYIINAQQDVFDNKQLRLIIVEQISQLPVGMIDLYDIDLYHSKAGVGILIYNSLDRKKGLAEDTLKLVQEYTVNTLGLSQLYAHIFTDNTDSIRLFEKANFTQQGLIKQWLRVSGKVWKDAYFYQYFG
ncbi:MAG: GNAT family N-acetyltransferase [Bacteroidales bacterium]|nr:GNAT family N-acetyltransferase [Bacteroidales bacterium]